MLWKIIYEVGSEGKLKEKLADIVDAVDIMDAVEIGIEQHCRCMRNKLGDGSYANLVEVRLIGGENERN